MICHQRTLREEHLEIEGCALQGHRLRDCKVQAIKREDAQPIILRYEWLHSMPQVGRAYYGLFRPDGKIIGAICFGAGPAQNARDFCGEKAIKRVIGLERGRKFNRAAVHTDRKKAAKSGYRKHKRQDN